MSDEKFNKVEAGVLWTKTSKGGKTYYSGKLSDGRKVIGFPKKDGASENAPDIKFYFDDPANEPF